MCEDGSIWEIEKESNKGWLTSNVNPYLIKKKKFKFVLALLGFIGVWTLAKKKKKTKYATNNITL